MATPPTTGRRIKAAMALAGYSIEDLSEQIGQRGLGPRTLRKLQDDSDPREARAWELRAIADACGVPYAWFTVDDLGEALDNDASLATESAQRLSTVEARQAAIGETLAELAEQLVAVRQEMREHRQDA